MAREAVMDRFRPHLSQAGVTEQQWRVLRALYEIDEMDAGQLAKEICLHMPSLSRILVDLSRRKLIHKRNGADRRLRTVSIARKGRELVDGISPASEAEYRWIEGSVGTKLYDQLSQNLDELVFKLENRRR
jgi:homoprotocatechuate degradation regulator HpaR